MADKAKIMIVSLPANPVGSVGSPELYQEIVDFCNAHKILLIHDNHTAANIVVRNQIDHRHVFTDFDVISGACLFK